jgi:cysteine synthase
MTGASKIKAADKACHIKGYTAILELTSGNTGIALHL